MPEETPHAEETGVETLMMDFLKLFCHKTIKPLNEKKAYHGTSQDRVYRTHTHTHSHTLPPA